MKYTVLWKPTAENMLATLWTEAPDRAVVTRAADTIDSLLAQNPLEHGESRAGNRRVVYELPLAVDIEVLTSDMTVHVLRVWRVDQPS
jgi:hypothetical protein